MPSQHVVQQGECIESIAEQHGFFPDTLWNHADNSSLREEREAGHVLLPGDVVNIPDLRLKEVSKEPEERHRFRRRGVPAMLRIVLARPNTDDPTQLEPWADVDYIVEIDGATLKEGTTGSDGLVESPIPPRARRGRLTVDLGGPDEQRIPLYPGGLDPADTPSGARARLSNICIASDDAEGMTDPLRDAIREFQELHGLTVDGNLEQPTVDKLIEIHGS